MLLTYRYSILKLHNFQCEFSLVRHHLHVRQRARVSVRYVHIPRVHLFVPGRTDGDVTSMGVLAYGFCEGGRGTVHSSCQVTAITWPCSC